MTVLLETNLPDRYHRGKVRDMYDLGDVLLMVVTDRISAFDVVLPCGIPHKGRVLAELSGFWFRQSAPLLPNHFIAMACEKEKITGLKAAPRILGLPAEISRRSMVVRKAQRINVECVVRGYITGSAWAEYREQGTIGGSKAPHGLRESQKLRKPLFTPTTKAETGHDQNLTPSALRTLVDDKLARSLQELSIRLYSYAHDYALTRGIVIADTKFEFGFIDGRLSVIDELLTPDSSRFWDAATFVPGKPQPSFDKQIVRDWLLQSGWSKEPPAPMLPPDIIEKTSTKYQEVYQRLVGKPLPEVT